MANNKVNLHDVYEAVSDLESKMDKRFDEMGRCISIHTEEITTLKIWRANLTGKISIIVACVSLVATLVVDWFRRKVNL